MDYVQSNHEGVLIDVIQQAEGHYDGIVFNPGGYSHTSIALADAVRCISVPVVEVHISNIYERESYRRHSFVAEAAWHLWLEKDCKAMQMLFLLLQIDIMILFMKILGVEFTELFFFSKKCLNTMFSCISLRHSCASMFYGSV